jgi:hypothetical protein
MRKDVSPIAIEAFESKENQEKTALNREKSVALCLNLLDWEGKKGLIFFPAFAEHAKITRQWLQRIFIK